MSGRKIPFQRVLCANDRARVWQREGRDSAVQYELVLMNRLRIQGFTVLDHVAQFEESTMALAVGKAGGRRRGGNDGGCERQV